MGGVPLFVNFVRGRTRDIYYPDYDDDENGNRVPDDNALGISQSKKHSQQALDRDARAARREQKRRVGWQASSTVDSQTPDLTLWMYNARKGQHQAHAMKAEKTREKVQAWLDSTKN
ncbi:hypothetical protein AX15_002073 [Amanita polypyramis BW_CC]|nr:hypothetical protein AX15_002073 [Amanita polypyramis BW_CC]